MTKTKITQSFINNYGIYFTFITIHLIIKYYNYMSDKVIAEIESQIMILKVYIHELKKENKILRAKIKKLHNDLSQFLELKKMQIVI